MRALCGAQAPLDRVVAVAFGANLRADIDLLRPGAVIATYASDAAPEPAVPFWPLLSKDLTVRFVLVYAMPDDAHVQTARWIGEALARGVAPPGLPALRSTTRSGARGNRVDVERRQGARRRAEEARDQASAVGQRRPTAQPAESHSTIATFSRFTRGR